MEAMSKAFQELRAALRGMRITHHAKQSAATAYASVELGHGVAIEVYLEDQLTGAQVFVVVRCDGPHSDPEWLANFPYASAKSVAMFIAAHRPETMTVKKLDAAIAALREHADHATPEEAQRLDRVIGMLMAARKEKAR